MSSNKPRYFRVQHTEGQTATFLARPRTAILEDIIQTGGAGFHPEPDSVDVTVYRLFGDNPNTSIYSETINDFSISGPNLFDSLQTDSKWPFSTGGYTWLHEIKHDPTNTTGVNWIGDTTYQVEYMFNDADDTRLTFVVDVAVAVTYPVPAS